MKIPPEFAERWFNDHLPGRNLKPTTVETYGFALQHLVGSFGDRRLADLATHPAIIDRYVAAKVRGSCPEHGEQPPTHAQRDDQAGR